MCCEAVGVIAKRKPKSDRVLSPFSETPVTLNTANWLTLLSSLHALSPISPQALTQYTFPSLFTTRLLPLLSSAPSIADVPSLSQHNTLLYLACVDSVFTQFLFPPSLTLSLLASIPSATLPTTSTTTTSADTLLAKGSHANLLLLNFFLLRQSESIPAILGYLASLLPSFSQFPLSSQHTILLMLPKIGVISDRHNDTSALEMVVAFYLKEIALISGDTLPFLLIGITRLLTEIGGVSGTPFSLQLKKGVSQLTSFVLSPFAAVMESVKCVPSRGPSVSVEVLKKTELAGTVELAGSEVAILSCGLRLLPWLYHQAMEEEASVVSECCFELCKPRYACKLRLVALWSLQWVREEQKARAESVVLNNGGYHSRVNKSVACAMLCNWLLAHGVVGSAQNARVAELLKANEEENARLADLEGVVRAEGDSCTE